MFERYNGSFHRFSKITVVYLLRHWIILFILSSFHARYGKCPKIPFTKVSDKMANAHTNSVDQDKTAP